MAVSTREMRRGSADATLITVPEAARLARVNEDTIRRWLRKGFVPGARVGVSDDESVLDRRHWRIPRGEFLERVRVINGGSPS